jgi:hypothetical protein
MPRRKSYTQEYENRLKEKTMISIAFASTLLSMLLAWGFLEQDNLPSSVVVIIRAFTFMIYVINFFTELFEWTVIANPIVLILTLFWTYFYLFRLIVKKAKEAFDLRNL